MNESERGRRARMYRFARALVGQWHYARLEIVGGSCYGGQLMIE